jgi:hypothetical protein
MPASAREKKCVASQILKRTNHQHGDIGAPDRQAEAQRRLPPGRGPVVALANADAISFQKRVSASIYDLGIT